MTLRLKRKFAAKASALILATYCMTRGQHGKEDHCGQDSHLGTSGSRNIWNTRAPVEQTERLDLWCFSVRCEHFLKTAAAHR